MVKIKIEVAKTQKSINDLVRNEAPFVVAMSLTHLAKGGQDAGQRRTRSEFKLRTDFIPRGIWIKPSKVQAVKKGFIQSSVFTSPKISRFMPIHEFGGITTPRGQAFVVPREGLKTKAYRTRTGKIRKRWKASELLKGYTRGKGPGSRQSRSSRKKPFILNAGGTGYIVRRLGKHAKPLEFLYVFTDRHKYNPEWDLQKTVWLYVVTNYERIFSDNFRKVLNNAGNLSM